MESLDLADRSSDKGTKKSQGLSLSACAGAWTLLAATPRRVTSVTVTWAGRIEKTAQRAREVRACVRAFPSAVAVAEWLFFTSLFFSSSLLLVSFKIYTRYRYRYRYTRNWFVHDERRWADYIVWLKQNSFKGCPSVSGTFFLFYLTDMYLASHIAVVTWLRTGWGRWEVCFLSRAHAVGWSPGPRLAPSCRAFCARKARPSLTCTGFVDRLAGCFFLQRRAVSNRLAARPRLAGWSDKSEP